jgi:hypothetical protein
MANTKNRKSQRKSNRRQNKKSQRKSNRRQNKKSQRKSNRKQTKQLRNKIGGYSNQANNQTNNQKKNNNEKINSDTLNRLNRLNRLKSLINDILKENPTLLEYFNIQSENILNNEVLKNLLETLEKNETSFLESSSKLGERDYCMEDPTSCNEYINKIKEINNKIRKLIEEEYLKEIINDAYKINDYISGNPILKGNLLLKKIIELIGDKPFMQEYKKDLEYNIKGINEKFNTDYSSLGQKLSEEQLLDMYYSQIEKLNINNISRLVKIISDEDKLNEIIILLKKQKDFRKINFTNLNNLSISEEISDLIKQIENKTEENEKLIE